ncbi:hypothetical protein [Rheinheimera sp.]|uniref:hypothetical protein n=1 Tax=Rheinheimera sp. TaxID=1869214 RepID=UPI004047B399
MLNWMFNWRLSREAKAHEKMRNTMLNVISANGMKAHKYFPGVGQHDNNELYMALDWLAGHGFIITDKNGEIVGKVATANMDRCELAVLRRSQIKLVESHTHSDGN